MCLTAWALQPRPGLALVLAANRDEFHDRPSLPMDWREDPAGGQPVLSGLDLLAGGTWLGVDGCGRLGLLTNVRQGLPAAHDGPSRGDLVPAWLAHSGRMIDFWRDLRPQRYAGFNLLGLDVQAGRGFWGSNQPPAWQALAQSGESGLHGLSNAALDTPWPKTVALTQALRSAVSGHGEAAAAGSTAALRQALLAALARRERAADADLPDTGMGLERERQLSSIFIEDPGRARYGTRCSTVVIVWGAPGTWQAEVDEVRFDAQGQAAGQGRFSFALKPPP
ncbi:NRDE family protein [Ideonella livida]|uniref:NRDE family protein n=1 Tax=Ideonella livida TaxID=2707176 RepID=A0A7C9TIK9_9BURK|nr:NRDE family protein [Ideonella livida]NDY90524.1 NRDE family protein [Ideonella livida]